MLKKKILLFWYSIYKFHNPPKLLSAHYIRRLLDKEKENYGDLLSKYLIEKITGQQPVWYNPGKENLEENFLAIGSILNYANSESIIWGSGIINKSHTVKCKEIKAVRGPLTRKHLQDLGFDCPKIYGDPALLLPEYYKPKIFKKYRLGIIPHWMDYQKANDYFGLNNEIRIINLLTCNIEKTTNAILECEIIISSSLHGMILAHAYNIPAVWVKFSDDIFGDNIKYYDYLESVGLKTYAPKKISNTQRIKDLESLLTEINYLPDRLHLEKMKKGLIQSCPFL